MNTLGLKLGKLVQNVFTTAKTGALIALILLGIIVGLWSKSFEQLNMPVVFFLTPLSMVGGVFNTVEMLPSWLRWLAWGNPFFYFINGIRGAMIGFDETPKGLGEGLTLLLLTGLGLTVWRLYAKGYGLRE
jgi:ABC-2 type transport system permease protein